MLKRNNVNMAHECGRLSRDLLGANGIINEHPIMRHMCNLETVKTYEGTDHIHALVHRGASYRTPRTNNHGDHRHPRRLAA